MLEFGKKGRNGHTFDNVLKRVGDVVNTNKNDVSKWASIGKESFVLFICTALLLEGFVGIMLYDSFWWL